MGYSAKLYSQVQFRNIYISVQCTQYISVHEVVQSHHLAVVFNAEYFVMSFFQTGNE